MWTWALYWAGGGLLLLLGGLDPVSLIFLGLCIAQFAIVMRGGALRPDASRNMREFMLERPFYLIGALVLLVFLAPVFSPLENGGMAAFSALHLGALVLCIVRLRQHLRANNLAVFASKADQAFILFGLMCVPALLVFLDAWIPLFGGTEIGGTQSSVAGVTWLSFFYPAGLLLAVRPFRAPLDFKRRKRAPVNDPAPAADPAKNA